MPIVQVIIDRTTSMNIEGNYVWDRVLGGTMVPPQGASFPSSPEAGELFWKTDEAVLYVRDATNTSWVAADAGWTPTAHEALRQLIHFIDGGPAEGFASGAYREITGTLLPSAIIWYDQAGAGKKKIVSKEIAYSGVFPTTITWKMYDAAETLLVTVTDTLSYSGAFETSRTRTIA